MAQLTETLARSRSRSPGASRCATSAAVASLAPGWPARLPPSGSPEGPRSTPDAVVLATHAAGAAALLGEAGRALPRRRDALQRDRLAWRTRRAAIDHPLDGTGFVVAAGRPGARLPRVHVHDLEVRRARPRRPRHASPLLPPRSGGPRADGRRRLDRARRGLARARAARARALGARVGLALVERAPGLHSAHAARVREVEQALAGSGVLLAGSALPRLRDRRRRALRRGGRGARRGPVARCRAVGRPRTGAARGSPAACEQRGPPASICGDRLDPDGRGCAP